MPNALETMKQLKDDGKKVIMLSNAPLTSDKVAELYEAKGFLGGTHYDDIITSGDVAYMVFSSDKRALKYYQMGHPVKELFANSSYVEVFTPNEADFVYSGTPQIQKDGVWCDLLDIDIFKQELDVIKALNKPLVCANPDKRAASGKIAGLAVRSGLIAQYYESIGGNVAYFGKPHDNIFDYAIGEEKTPKTKILMVGDTLGTDILGANNYDISSALVMTGISAEEMKESGKSDIEEYAQEVGIVPTYFVKSI